LAAIDENLKAKLGK